MSDILERIDICLAPYMRQLADGQKALTVSGDGSPVYLLACAANEIERLRIEVANHDDELRLMEEGLEEERDEALAEVGRLRAKLDAVSTEEWDRIVRERDEAKAEIERLRKVVALMNESITTTRTTNFQTNLTLMCDLKQAMREREEAREAARRLVTVLANGDASVIERAIEEYPWLKEEDDE